MCTKHHDWLLLCFGHLKRQPEPVKDEDRPTVGAYDGRVESFTCDQGFSHTAAGIFGRTCGPLIASQNAPEGSSAALVII